MAEGDRAVVRVALLDEDVAVEPAHLRDGEDADAAEGTGLDGQDLALGDVAAEVAVGVALQAVEGNLARRDVSFECAAREVGLGACRFEQTVLDELILDGTVLILPTSCATA